MLADGEPIADTLVVNPGVEQKRARFRVLLTACMTYLVAITVGPAAALSAQSLSPAPTAERELLGHINVLASDSFEGREPGTPGEAKTIAYLTAQFANAGLEPLGEPGFVQEVPSLSLFASGQLTVRSGSSVRPLDPAKDFIVQAGKDVTLSGEPVVFAGYGIIAPEFGRDDFGTTDVTNKVVIVLGGEPPGFPERTRSMLGAAALDAVAENKQTLHDWYWSKQVHALKRGAKAVLILATDGRIQAKRRYFQQDYWEPQKAPAMGPALSGFVSERLFTKGGPLSQIGLDELRRRANSPQFQPFTLPVRVDGKVTVRSRPFVTRNVVGKIDGSGPGCVVLTAHWDAHGRDAKIAGDNIWNGAVDDAGGVAQLIEIARRLAAQGRPRRSIIILAATGEERGFIGTRHFLAQSPCPTRDVAAVINLDWFYELGRTERFASHGLGYSSLDEPIERIVRRQGRKVTAVNAYYAGGDQFPFMLAGIPGFHGGSVAPLVDYPKGYEESYYERLESISVQKEGHKNEDEVRPEWDLRGAVQDAEAMLRLSWEVANMPAAPCWKVRSQFADKARMCR